MTLGGGTAASSLFAGRMFGYELLWVAPAGMLIGILLLGVLARLALEDAERPYAAMARSAGKWVAVAWAWAPSRRDPRSSTPSRGRRWRTSAR